MIDSVVPNGRSSQRSLTRPSQYGVTSSYPRSQPRPDVYTSIHPVSAPINATAPAPTIAARQPLVTTAPSTFIPQDVTPQLPRFAQPLELHTGHAGYHPTDIDDVYSKIATIEAETPIVSAPVPQANAPTVIATPAPADLATTAAATLAQTPSRRRSAHTPLKSRKKILRQIRSTATSFVCMAILLVTGYISVDTWLTNQQVKEVVAQKQEAVVKGVALGEGDDETPVTPAVIDNYQVAADLPRMLIVQKLGIKARVLPMGVNSDGSMQAPVNINDSGWYNASAKPGTKGAAVIDAHASGASRQGLFAYLDTLKVGDKLSIEKGDGQLLNYEVAATETVPMNDVDMRKVLTPFNGAQEGLNLITCTGTWLPDQRTYDRRIIVYTKQV